MADEASKEQNLQSFTHETVLLDEATTALIKSNDGVYVDATFGRGGHSRAILQRLSTKGRLLVIDKDNAAIDEAKKLAQQDQRVMYWQGTFGDMRQALNFHALAKVDGILMDLGVSSPQLDDAARGFSFQRDGALDMRMSQNEGQTAAEWLNSADEIEIAKVLWEYGEERHSRRIARAIVAQRVETPFIRTLDLARFIEQVMPGRREKGKHPATRSFQAIRIHINNELDDLKEGLDASIDCLEQDGRLVAISFHSLEDRIVKRFLKKESEAKPAPRGLPVEVDISHLTMKRIGKAIKASLLEVERNARARSAVMRIGERL